jgi:uncharacterized protein YPO0396
MSDYFNRARKISQPVRWHWVPLLFLAFILIAIGDAVILASNRTASDQSEIGSSSPPEDVVGVLQQKVRDAVDRINDLQRQLSAEQGERKLLSEQIAALAERVELSNGQKERNSLSEQIGALAARVDRLDRASAETTGLAKRRVTPR